MDRVTGLELMKGWGGTSIFYKVFKLLFRDDLKQICQNIRKLQTFKNFSILLEFLKIKHKN